MCNVPRPLARPLGGGGRRPPFSRDTKGLKITLLRLLFFLYFNFFKVSYPLYGFRIEILKIMSCRPTEVIPRHQNHENTHLTRAPQSTGRGRGCAPRGVGTVTRAPRLAGAHRCPRGCRGRLLRPQRTHARFSNGIKSARWFLGSLPNRHTGRASRRSGKVLRASRSGGTPGVTFPDL